MCDFINSSLFKLLELYILFLQGSCNPKWPTGYELGGPPARLILSQTTCQEQASLPTLEDRESPRGSEKVDWNLMKDKSGLWCTSKENVQGGAHQENWDLEIEDPAE